MRSEEWKMVMAINSSLSERSERSLLTVFHSIKIVSSSVKSSWASGMR